MTICDNQPPDRPEIEQVTGGVSDGVMRVLADGAGDGTLPRPALRIFEMNAFLSMGTDSLTVGWVPVGWVSVAGGQATHRVEPEPALGGTTA